MMATTRDIYHILDGGRLIDIGDVSIGPGTLPLYKCERCGKEIDASEFERIGHLVNGIILDYKDKPTQGKMEPTNEKTLTLKEIADRLHVSHEAVRLWVLSGELKATRQDSIRKKPPYIVTETDLNAFIKGRENQ